MLWATMAVTGWDGILGEQARDETTRPSWKGLPYPPHFRVSLIFNLDIICDTVFMLTSNLS